jgi:hypothetical protein
MCFFGFEPESRSYHYYGKICTSHNQIARWPHNILFHSSFFISVIERELSWDGSSSKNKNQGKIFYCDFFFNLFLNFENWMINGLRNSLYS